MQSVIVQYARNTTRKVGTVVGFIGENNEIVIGYSRCNRKDRFDKRLGKALAILNGLEAGHNLPKEFKTLPRPLRVTILKVLDRSVRYFKQANNPCSLIQEALGETD